MDKKKITIQFELDNIEFINLYSTLALSKHKIKEALRRLEESDLTDKKEFIDAYLSDIEILDNLMKKLDNERKKSK